MKFIKVLAKHGDLSSPNNTHVRDKTMVIDNVTLNNG